MRIGFFRLTPGVRNIMVVTSAFWLLDLVILRSTGAPYMADLLGLVANPVGEPARTWLQVWRPFTYLLVHGDFWHLFWNMIGLWFLGAGLEEHLGEQRLYRVYVASGLAGALVAILAGFLTPTPVVIGASGAVMGVVFAFLALFPNEVITLLFMLVVPISIRALYLGVIYAIIQIYLALSTLGGGGGGVSYMAHLGGIAAGVLMARYRFWFDGLHGFHPTTGLKRKWRRRHLRSVPSRGPVVTTIPDPPPRPADPSLEQQVDAILDKVRTRGMEALTPEEKRTLDLHSTRLRSRDRAW